MQFLTALAAVVAIGLVEADYNTIKIADKEFLLKQKKIYNLLYYVSQSSLVNPILYKEGCSYNIETNIDSYTSAVKNFLYLYKYGMLPRGELSSIYYPKHLKETEVLFRLFYYAKDYDVLYKTALWARIYMNEMQYIYILYFAIIHRKDTRFIQLSPIYEVYPFGFFNFEVLIKANHPKFFGKLA